MISPEMPHTTSQPCPPVNYGCRRIPQAAGGKNGRTGIPVGSGAVDKPDRRFFVQKSEVKKCAVLSQMRGFFVATEVFLYYNLLCYCIKWSGYEKDVVFKGAI